MKIGMMAHTVYESDARVRNTVEAFAQRGDTVHLICLRDPREKACETQGSVTIYRPVRMRKPSNIVLYMLQLAWFVLVSTWQTLVAQIRHRYDIIYVHTIPDILVLAGVVPKLLGARVVLDMHEIMPELYRNRHHAGQDSLLLKAMIWMEKVSIRIADHVFVAAPFLVDTLHGRHHCRQKLTVMLNLPNPRYFTLPAAETRKRDTDEFHLIYPGTLSELHGVDVALAAMQIIKEETDWPIFFHIYGRGPQKEALVLIAQKAGLSQVRFHDEVAVERLGQLLQQMDLGIVSKRSGVFAEDAVSTKLLEFAATALPAVVSRTRGDMIFFDDSMFVFVEPGNARALADGIMALYLDRRRYVAMSMQLQCWAEEKLWEKQKQMFCSIIDRLAARHGAKVAQPSPAGLRETALESTGAGLDQIL